MRPLTVVIVLVVCIGCATEQKKVAEVPPQAKEMMAQMQDAQAEYNRDRGAFEEKVMGQMRKNPSDFQAGMGVFQLAIFDSMAKLKPEAERRPVFENSRKYLSEALSLAEKAHAPMSDMLRSALMEANYYSGHLDEAAGMASQMLNGGTSQPNAMWDEGNVVHNANMLLAMVDLDRNDPEKAIKHLAAAGKSSGSPQLNSFGPQFPALPRLLEAGKRDEVVGYLNGIQKFWKMDRGRISGWVDEIRSGGTPRDPEWRRHTMSL